MLGNDKMYWRAVPATSIVRRVEPSPGGHVALPQPLLFDAPAAPALELPAVDVEPPLAEVVPPLAARPPLLDLPAVPPFEVAPPLPVLAPPVAAPPWLAPPDAAPPFADAPPVLDPPFAAPPLVAPALAAPPEEAPREEAPREAKDGHRSSVRLAVLHHIRVPAFLSLLLLLVYWPLISQDAGSHYQAATLLTPGVISNAGAPSLIWTLTSPPSTSLPNNSSSARGCLIFSCTSRCIGRAP